MRRVDAPSRAPFLPYGVVPLGALFLLLLFGVTFFSRSIEDVVERTTRQALETAGATWATAHVSGQWVTLEGAPPSRKEAERVLAAVRNAETGTLLGQAIPATRVTERFVWTGPTAAPAALNSPASVVTAASATPAPRTEIAAPPPTEAAACDSSLATLLGSAKIEFASSSAVIGSASSSLLNSIAKAAAACPGTLRIEGHTDSSGGNALNQDLSRRRAEAVRAALVQRGVPERRLTVEGFGDTRPIASNAAASGRERNRRIEMRVIQPSD